MKIFNKILLSACVAGAAMSFGSCTDDLNLKPTDPRSLVAEQFKADPAGYMDALIADCYLQFATYGANGNSSVQNFDGGMSTFQRAVFYLEELPTDEACWLQTGDTQYGTFQYGILPADNNAIMGMYSRLFINIAVCNQFIQTVNENYFNTEGNATLQAKADEYIRQAKILRAAAYYYAIDCFGNVPFMDENTPMGVTGVQLGRAELYNRLVAGLEDIVAEYKAMETPYDTPYGYVGLDAAESLLVKYYLNAGVYTGTPNWAKTIEHADAVIGRRKGAGFQSSGLMECYHQNFAANNDEFSTGAAGAVKEIIWTIPQSIPELKSYANGTFMLNAWISTSNPESSWQLDPKTRYNAGAAGWTCMVGRRQFIENFEWNASMSLSPDLRTLYWATAADGFTAGNTPLVYDYYGSNGFPIVKFTNWALKDDGSVDAAKTPAATDQLGIDYPMIRLAEIYLSAAEAYLHQDPSDGTGKATEYTNYIRERAGMPAYAHITLQELEKERCRELYTESTRRTDLIRYGKWISGYTWYWKNNVANGADFASNFDIYPIPSSVVARNGYTQNPGY